MSSKPVSEREGAGVLYFFSYMCINYFGGEIPVQCVKTEMEFVPSYIESCVCTPGQSLRDRAKGLGRH